MNPDKISKFIYELRTEKKLSQYQLADKIPISRQAVSKWERGQTIPDSSTLIRLSEIFGVTINELLKGERLPNNSIEDLETTTLSIIDESNKKSRKIRKIIVIFTITIMTLLLAFLSYYFINSYNTIKVYTIGSKNEKFDIYDGIFITAKNKTYLKLGKVVPNNDIEIQNITVYYLKKKEKRIIFQDVDTDKVIIDLYGYQENFPEVDVKSIIKNTYIEISYNNKEKEVIHLTFARDFVNDAYLFHKNKKGKKTKLGQDDKTQMEKEIIQIIKEKGTKIDNTYILNKKENLTDIRFAYYEDTKQIIMQMNREIMWTILIEDHIYSCPILVNEKENTNEKCKTIIEKDIEKYLK